MIHPRLRVRAFSLVEVTLALGVAGFCLIALFGLLPIGVQTNQRSSSQTAATAILSNVIADMRATPKANTTSLHYGIGLSDNSATTVYFDGNGGCSTFINGNTRCGDLSTWIPTLQVRYRLAVTIPPNPAGTNAATFAYLRLTWPAAVDPASGTPGGTSEMFAAFTRN